LQQQRRSLGGASQAEKNSDSPKESGELKDQ
jgi:hypothetical protein